MRGARLLFAFVILCALGGCESAELLRDRSASTFEEEDPNSRALAGRVFAGTETVPGAVVRIDVAREYQADVTFAERVAPSFTTSTDLTGIYRFDRAPFRYDLAVVRERDVLVYSALGVRFMEPSVSAEGTIQAWSGRVDVVTRPALTPGNAVALFVSGPDAVGVTNDESGGRFVTFRKFTSVVTVHAVEYVAREGLGAAVREGRTDVRLSAGGAAATAIDLIPVTRTTDVVVDATPPPGFAFAGPIEVVMDLGLRTSAEPVARIAAGTSLKIAAVPGARYAARVRAHAGAAVSDSGLFFFDPFQTKVTIPLPTPATRVVPIDDGVSGPPVAETAVGQTPAVGAVGRGVHEHVLAPAGGEGPTLRIVTGEGPVAVPDVTRYGMPRLTGRYTWTVQRFPDLRVPDALSGRDARVAPQSATTSPRIIVFP